MFSFEYRHTMELNCQMVHPKYQQSNVSYRTNAADYYASSQSYRRKVVKPQISGLFLTSRKSSICRCCNREYCPVTPFPCRGLTFTEESVTATQR